MCGGPTLDVVSDVIGTGGGDQGLLNVVDEGVQSVGSGLAEVDDFVNEEIPGGWATGAAVAAPLFAKVLETSLRLLNVAPDEKTVAENKFLNQSSSGE